MEEDTESIQIVIPHDKHPGDTITVEAPDGRLFAIIIPAGVTPGQPLVVTIPKNSELGTNVSHMHSNNAKAVGVTAAAAVVGTLLVGPIVGLAVAGCALYATTREDQIGESARTIGDATCSLYDRTVELCQKYEVKEKVTTATTATAAKMSQIDAEYKISENAIAGAKSLAKQAQEADEKYKITESATKAITQTILFGAKEISRLTSNTSNSPPIQSTPVQPK